LSYGYRIDLLIEDKLVVELKASEYLHSLYTAQTLTYMKLINAKLGLLINFNVPLLKDGIKRIINGKQIHLNRHNIIEA
jgi:GxxExxY protein